MNRRLATALGWTSIVDVDGALIGTPPAGQAACRGQAKVPDWTGDWRDCGPLAVEHHILLKCFPRGVVVTAVDDGVYASHADHASADAATRFAIVAAVCGKFGVGA